MGQLIPELDFKLCSVKASFTGHARNVELTPFLFGLFGYESRRGKNKAELLNLRKLLFQLLKGIDREASRRNGHFAALLDLYRQIVFKSLCCIIYKLHN